MSLRKFNTSWFCSDKKVRCRQMPAGRKLERVPYGTYGPLFAMVKFCPECSVPTEFIYQSCFAILMTRVRYTLLLYADFLCTHFFRAVLHKNLANKQGSLGAVHFLSFWTHRWYWPWLPAAPTCLSDSEVLTEPGPPFVPRYSCRKLTAQTNRTTNITSRII